MNTNPWAWTVTGLLNPPTHRALPPEKQSKRQPTLHRTVVKFRSRAQKAQSA